MKRAFKSFLALTMVTSIAFSSLMSPIALAADPIPSGESGYASMHTYVSPTNYPNVYKVNLKFETLVKMEKQDIIFLVDNSRNMGIPDDQTPEVKALKEKYDQNPNPTYTQILSYIDGSNPANSKYDLKNRYGWLDALDAGIVWREDFIMGAWPFGHLYGDDRLTNIGWDIYDQPYGAYQASYVGDGYRFEWMKSGLKDAVKMLLDDTSKRLC